MKYLISFILIAILASNVYSQDLLSFTPKIQKYEPSKKLETVLKLENKIKYLDSLSGVATDSKIINQFRDNKIDAKNTLDDLNKAEMLKLQKDIDTLDALLKGEKDSKIITEIINAKTRLEREKTILKISATGMDTELGQTMIKYITRKVTEPTLMVAGDIQLRPAGENKDNYFSPIITANYKHDLVNSGHSHFLLQYDFLLSILAPSSTTDTNKMITRILSSGPDGVFQAGLKIGNLWTEDAFMYGINGKLNWLNSRSIKGDNFASFAYLSCSHLLLARLGPVIIGYEQEFRFVDSDSKDLLSKRIDKAMSGNLLIGIRTGQMQFQLKYLLNSNGKIESDERLEIKVGAALDLLN